jgi:hypothetical protein
MGHPKPTKFGIPGFVDDARHFGQEVITAFAGAIELRKVLAAFQNAPPGTSKPARDLTDQEAFDLLMHLVFRGEIMLDEKIRTDAAGKIVYPVPGKQMRVRARMSGIEYKHATNPTIRHFTAKPALAIALYRMAQKLNGGYYGVTEIVWGGAIGYGHEGKKANCHEIGTCIDIYSASMRFGKFEVAKDWGLRPVFKSDGTRVQANDVDPWGDATKTFYRLREKDNGVKYFFFIELYRAGVEQFTIGPTDNLDLEEGKPVKEGANMFHPDYPGIDLRRSHQEHMHFQIGPSYL